MILDWRAMNKLIPSLTELEIKAMLDEEAVTLRRKTALQRLHQRFCILRAARERRELMG